MKKYKTDSLDLAAYLMTKGIEPKKTVLLSNVLCEYSYPIDVEKYVKTFFQGNAQVNVTKFLYARYHLKRTTNKLGMIKDKETKEDIRGKYSEFDGEVYWFIGASGLTHKCIFDSKKMRDIERKQDGNYYPSEELAKLGAKYTK